jgi:MFS family permease
LMLIGVGFALFSSPNSNAVMSSVTAKDYGVASATLGTMRLVGQALSMALVAVILAVFMADNRVGRESAPELLASVRTAFTLFAVFSVIGTLASLARGRVRPNQGATTILGRS